MILARSIQTELSSAAELYSDAAGSESERREND
jgi:hypothetical protein